MGALDRFWRSLPHEGAGFGPVLGLTAAAWRPTANHAPSGEPADAGRPIVAASAASPSCPDASVLREAGASASPVSVVVSRGGRELPSASRLVAPFGGRAARGFVGVTAMGGVESPRHRVVALDEHAVPDEHKPVLVASLSKLWTAVAALRMVERGELSLDATVKELLPALASRPWADSTLRELMSHTSRVPELEGDGYFRRADVDFSTPIEVLAKSLSRVATEKRGVYKYRNAEYALVGAILSARAELPAAEVLAREVFAPAKMTDAGLLVGKGPPPAGLDLVPMGPIRPQNFFTAGAGYASASDLLAFFDALAGRELLQDASKDLLFAGVEARGHHALGCWAYPFARPDGGTTRIVERPGSFGNVRLYTAFFPEEKRAIVAYTSDGLDLAKPHAQRGIGPSLARIAIE